MNITAAAINNNRVSIMVFLIIIIMGLLSYSKLSRDSMPPYTVRFCTVVTQFPGASPERVEALITSKIEEEIQEIPELDNVTSESRTGLSVVTVELDDAVTEDELQPVWDKIRRDMEALRPELPEGIIGPEVKDDDIGVVYGIMLALEGDGFTFKELEDIADDMKDDLIKLPDASRVEVQGVQDEQIYVEYDDASLARLGISVTNIRNIISATNIVFPGGDIVLEDKRITLEPSGNYEDIDDLKNTLIPFGNGEQVQLGNITTISREYIDPITRQVRVDGKPNLTISVALIDGGNLSNLGKAIDAKIAEYNSTYPIGLNVRRAASQDEYVNKKISDFLMNVIQSIVIVLIVMLLFLGVRTGIVVSSLIPMVMIMTILLMSIMEVGLNQVSLAALIMALGLLVDNAIVMAESIMVKMEQGSEPKQAAIESSKELMFPLLISSLTTSAAFLAFFLAESVMGEIMGPLFVVITLALLSSWIMGMTLVTMLGVAMIRVNDKKASEASKTSTFDKINVYYKKVLLTALRRPVFFLLIIIGMFAGSLALFGQLPFIFFPDSDRNLVTLDLNLPLGTKIEKTVATVAQIEEFMKDSLVGEAGVRDWTSFIAEGPESYDLGYTPGESNSGYAHMLINTNSMEDNQRVINALDAYCFNNLPDAEVVVGLLAGGGSSGADVEVRVAGDSPDELFAIAERMKQKMAALPFTKNIKDDWGPKIKKFIIDIDPDIAQRAGMTNQDIALSLQSSLSGYEIGSFREGDNTIPIVSRTLGSQEITVFQLASINIYSQQSGKSVPLAQVAEIRPTFDFAKILRRDLYRTMTVSCDVKEGYTATNALNELLPYISEDQAGWPDGYSYELGGESESSADAMEAVAENLPLAGFIIVFLLVLQFNSFRKTTIVLLSIPLGLIGVILGLLMFNSYFGFMAFMGVISLAGIVINNAIVLIDRIGIELEEFQREPHEAVIAAAQQRFRPILLTTLTTSLGLIPLYLGGGLMWEPLAISIMIGLLFATVITLLFVPVMYSLFYKVRFK